MADYFLAMLVIVVVLAGWSGVQHLARRFAVRHPEFGPAREEGSGCGSSCSCHGGGACSRQTDGRTP